MMPTILRRPDVERVTGLPRSSIYERMAEGKFPKPVKLGDRAVGWVEAEIAKWLEQRIVERDARGTRRKRSKS